MTENLTKAKELYLDIAIALTSLTRQDRTAALKLVFELYLLVEHGEKLLHRQDAKDAKDYFTPRRQDDIEGA